MLMHNKNMAGQVNLRKSINILRQNCALQWNKCYATAAAKPRTSNTIEAVGKSLSAKGFLRPNKPYAAPENVAERIKLICGSLKISDSREYKLANLGEKFTFLSACFNDFQHSIPNSQIHELETIGDVVSFYQSSVDTTVPYDALKKMDLPENLHIQYDYVRFNPETDTKFNGQTAFPKSSTLVTGLKYRGKYEGHEAKRSWP